jgi:hypothetical protein
MDADFRMEFLAVLVQVQDTIDQQVPLETVLLDKVIAAVMGTAADLGAQVVVAEGQVELVEIALLLQAHQEDLEDRD